VFGSHVQTVGSSDGAIFLDATDGSTSLYCPFKDKENENKKIKKIK